jgi:hypothetical protein
MLNRNFVPRLLEDTTSTIEKRLTTWIDWLRSGSSLAFGDDPGPVYQMEDELCQLVRLLDKLRSIFNRSNTTFEAVLAYRSTRESFYQASDLVATIRAHDYGSLENTHTVLIRLLECRERLRVLPLVALAAHAIGEAAAISD